MLLALLWGIPLAGCGATAAAYDRILRLPLEGREARDPGLLDPARATASTPLAYASLTQVGLVKLGPDLHVLPELAVSLPTISTGGRSYTFTIRQDARFADGKRSTAADVAYSMARALRFGSPLAQRYLGGIEGAGAVVAGRAARVRGITVLRRLTLRIRLRQPDESFLTKLAFPVAAVVEPGATKGPPPGLGPFTLVGQAPDGTVTLRPRPHFYGDPPRLREVRLVPVATPQHGLALYRTGALDATRVPFRSFAALRQRADFLVSPALDAYYAIPQDGPRRRAPTLDRTALTAAVGPAVEPLAALVPPAVPDYQSAPPVSPRPVLARGQPARIRAVGRADAGDRAVRSALLRQWRGSPAAPAVTVAHRSYLLPDPVRWLTLSPDARRSRWYRAVIRLGERLTNDPVARLALYARAERWSLDRGSVIPLASGKIAFLEKPAVGGLEVTPEGLMPANGDWRQVTLNPMP